MSIKDHVLNKIQVVIGFLFLTCGFVLQGVRAWAASDQRGTVVAVCLSLLCFAALVYLVGSLYSRHSFRRHLRDFFRHHPDWVFRDHMGLTKEVGAILGVEQGQDETVEDYVRKVKVALRIAQKSPPAQAVSDRTRRLREMAPLASPGGPGAGTGPGVPRGARL